MSMDPGQLQTGQVTGGVYADFRAPITGAARWFVTGANDVPVSVCRSEGETIVRKARSALNNVAPGLSYNALPNTGLNVTDDWRPLLRAVAQTNGHAREGSTLDLILGRSMDTWTDSDMGLVTGLLVWIAFYLLGPLKYANGTDVPLTQIVIPGNSITLQFPGTDTLPTVDGFEGTQAAVYQSQDLTPRCAGPSDPLPPINQHDLPIGAVDPAAVPARSAYVAKPAERRVGWGLAAAGGVLVVAGGWAARKKWRR